MHEKWFSVDDNAFDRETDQIGVGSGAPSPPAPPPAGGGGHAHQLMF
jgi:hypothetical protein